MYRKLTKDQRRDYEQVKRSLLTAFATDSFVAYSRFMGRQLRQGETVDVYLAELQQIALLIGELPERWMACAFVAGLPGEVRRSLRSSARMDTMSLDQLLDRARAIMTEEMEEPIAAAARPAREIRRVPTPAERTSRSEIGHSSRTDAGRPSRGDSERTTHRNPGQSARGDVICYKCSGHNHFARDCKGQRGEARTEEPRSDRIRRQQVEQRRCFICRAVGHFASGCPENDDGGETSAPVSPRASPTRRYRSSRCLLTDENARR